MQRLASRELVLAGAGHTNLHIVRMWLQQPIADVQLTVVSPTPYATYSGMFPGTLAGLYAPEEMLIDLDQLTHAAGARLIVAECIGIDVPRRRVLLKDRPGIPFDMVSVGVGSRPAGMESVAKHPGLISIKPMFTAMNRLRHRLSELTSAPDEPNKETDVDKICIVVVGAGAAGVEIAFCVRQFIRREYPNLWQRGIQVSIIDRHDSILRGYRPSTRRIAEQKMADHQIQKVVNCTVVSCDDRQLLLDNCDPIPADVVLWCAGATAVPLLDAIDLPKSGNGFLRVKSTLQTITGEPVFAVGDSASIDGASNSRAGVYAVRQGPILWQNIHRMFVGQPLVHYRPQRDFLSLLAIGDGSAIGQYRWLSSHGRWLWRLKDRIDSKFMSMHRPSGMQTHTHNRQTSSGNISAQLPEMRCRGCGGKTSGGVLNDVLQRLRDEQEGSDEDFLQPEDAVILTPGRAGMNAVSVDMFNAFIDDPWLVGRIAAIHSLSDLWARRIQPTAAMAMLTVPSGSRRAQSELLYQLLKGVVHEVNAADVVLGGGHTMDGDEISIGLAVLGRTQPHPDWHKQDLLHNHARKGGMQNGQKIILTKALGTGVILAGREFQSVNSGGETSSTNSIRTTSDALQNALKSMLLSNQLAAELASHFQITGITDVTGFGLAGHLFEMLDASRVSAWLMLNQIPLIDGSRELFDAGIRSSLDSENREVATRIHCDESRSSTAEWHALFDPQTSGGLLMGVSGRDCDAVLQQLHASGYKQASVIGEVAEGSHQDSPIQIQIRPS